MADSGMDIYLDYAATTPVDPAVADTMVGVLRDPALFGNPSSSHEHGEKAHRIVETARGQVARLVGIDTDGVIFTSGATESDNLAIAGVAHYESRRGRHLISQVTEHKAVIDILKSLEQEVFDVTLLVPDNDGIVDPGQVQAALRDDTTLVSIMHANNETGALQDVAAIGRVCREAGVLFHVDAAQSAAREVIDMPAMHIDLLSLTAHKMYGPKGVGALCIDRSRVPRLSPMLHGGAQESGLRPGTLATHQIAALGKACELAGERRNADVGHIAALSERLATGLLALPGVRINGRADRRVAGILSATFEAVEGESFMYALKGLSVSAGAACNSVSAEPSVVLRAMGLTDRDAQGTVRFSIGRCTSEAEVDAAIGIVAAALDRLGAILPLEGAA